MKRTIVDHLKNVSGWKTNRKLVIFAVDDYGNVRRHSKTVGVSPQANRFDIFDTLETRADLEALVETLTAVKDKEGKPAVFTAYALPHNPDFDKIAESHFRRYYSEPLPTTFKKLSAERPGVYEGTWKLWRECINNNLIVPQFHGREHLNLNLVQAKLKNADKDIVDSFRQRSVIALDDSNYNIKGWTAAFSFSEPKELEQHQQILEQGLYAFKNVFDFNPTVFTPPAQQFHPKLYPTLIKKGVKAIDRPFIYRQHQGKGKYTWKWERIGLDKKAGLTKLLRNVVFEPNIGSTDHIGKAMKQIDIAFRWNKPAIISSHRVNFCGLIDPKNREDGLSALKELLKNIVERWPSVEFISAGKLIDIMSQQQMTKL